MSGHADPQPPLDGFFRSHDFFIGIDSDGCAFDTMEVKHKECFIPEFVRHFGLAAVSRYAREASEFVNLYSKDRGSNRFPAYLKALDLLAERPEVRRRGVRVPTMEGLRDWIAREKTLGNPTLQAEVDRSRNPDLARALAWSVAVNHAIEATVRDVPPFPWMRASLEAMAGKADVMVVSATPKAALVREWEEHGLARLVGLIAGQELGGKDVQLARAAPADRYARGHVLMVGDAPGDRAAAAANGALFYPIEPGREDESWRRFHDEALPRFFAGAYGGDYLRARLDAFEALLPETPPWQTA